MHVSSIALTKKEIRIGRLDYSNSWARIQQSLVAKKKKKENPKGHDHNYVGKEQLQVQGHNSNIFKVWVLINFFMLSREKCRTVGDRFLCLKFGRSYKTHFEYTIM